jgi:5-methylcytosine-specific restriction protein A
MKRYICRSPGCGTLLEKPGYCPLHKREKEKNKSKPFENAIRSNEELYQSLMWKALKKRVLTETPFCCYCGIGKNESRLEVHHKIPPRGDLDLFFDINNLTVLCSICHQRQTALEIANRRLKK